MLEYRAKVRREHRNRAVLAGFDLYAWFWFHTQFWIKDPEKRRPYTYIFRDWIFTHLAWFYLISGIWFAGLGVLLLWQPLAAYILGVLSALVWAHCRWGEKWTPNQQESPPYLG